MQKKILAAVVASMVAGQAMAVTIVDNGTDKVTIGGHIGMRYVDQTDSEATGDSSRINFGFEHKLTEMSTAFAKAEWGFSTVSTGDDGDFFNQRLGYVGVKNDQFGAVSFGKQWSSYYMISGWTDMFATADVGIASGTYTEEGETLGTARADDALQFNHSMMGLNISAQTQLGERKNIGTTNHTRDGSYGIAASYDMPMGLSIGAAYNHADVKSNGAGEDYKSKSAIVGAKFEADKIYAAINYADMSNVQVEIGGTDVNYDDAKGLELYASYQLNEMFKLEGGYNQLDGDKNGVAEKGEIKNMPVAVVYTQGPIQLSGTYQYEKSKKLDGTDVDDKIIMQARYYF